MMKKLQTLQKFSFGRILLDVFSQFVQVRKSREPTLVMVQQTHGVSPRVAVSRSRTKHFVTVSKN